MNLNQLKPAWRQYVLFHSLPSLDREEILSIIETAERQSLRRWPRQIAGALSFLILTACCQGG
jgi:hypothetical protein